MKTFTFIAVLAFCLCLAQGARAEGKFAELMRQRMQAKSGGGFDIDGGDAPCSEHDGKVVKIMNGPMGKKLRGQTPDIADVAYGPAPRQKMDIFVPPKPKTPAPIIFMVHGGGWCTGDKSMKQMTGDKVTRWVPEGFVFISVNYPMVGDGNAAGPQAEDIARAIVFVQKNAEKFGGDPAKVILMGHSAGAHLISLVNADAGLRERMGVQPILGAISLDAGAVNVVTQMPNVVPIVKMRYKEAFGDDEANWIALSPFHKLDKTAAPWLGVCSTTRPDKPCDQAAEYVKKSLALGINADTLPQRKSHGEINKDLGGDNDYTRAVEKFMATLDPQVAHMLKR